MWRGFVGKLCLRIEIFFVPRGNKEFANILNVDFVRKKIGSARKLYTSFPLTTSEYCCLPGKLQSKENSYLFFLYKIDEIPAILSNLGDWRAARARACLLRFSALKIPKGLLLFNSLPVAHFEITATSEDVCCSIRNILF